MSACHNQVGLCPCSCALLLASTSVYPVSMNVLSTFICNSCDVAGRRFTNHELLLLRHGPMLSMCLLNGCDRPCLMLKQPGSSRDSPMQPGLAVLDFAYAKNLCNIAAYLQVMVIATLPLCIAVGNLYTLHSDETRLDEASTCASAQTRFSCLQATARSRTDEVQCRTATASVTYAGQPSYVCFGSHLELNVTAFRQLHFKCPHIAIIPLHLRSIADIPVSKRRMPSHNLVAFTERYLHIA